ncbi:MULTISPECIES: peptidoglycan-binding domain-containing protein [unclassified Streptomyces]|uniref:peptidoglycan-binding domain-containing protein n=1 Tax=unclassified Streptomyces TaxID=2593676 RepID=UPI000F9B3406|nr:peptidoglycan-binding domain-containing protein [Streptomyces sp. ADI95-17]RPK54667.1 HlyD family secretion protein [Streptomyces sp. ADI95-17]WSX07287.1 peptidoglycan-binding protein [Streptomyces sp. NBC_00987]
MSRTVETTAPDGTSPAPARKKHRKAVVALVLVAALGGSGALAAIRPWEQHGTASAKPSVSHGTVAVQKGSLSTGIQVGGALSYSTPTPVITSGHGTITALPAVGAVVKAGAKLYEVDGRPVVLLTGDRPMWRDLGPDISDGPDVEQLKRNLIKLGHADGLGLTADQKFTPATVTAVKRWQKALGEKQTGTVSLGSVVMLPQAAVRVQQLGAQLGSALGATAVMTVSGTDLVATVQPADNQLSQFKPNGRVTVKLADGSTINGRIRSLVHGGSGNGGDNGPDGSGGADKTTVTIALDHQRQAKQAGPSSVTVTVVGETVSDALIVPVTALLALDGGGYGVQVVSGATTRLVRIQLGLVADAKAQITGDVQAGAQVVIPK